MTVTGGAERNPPGPRARARAAGNRAPALARRNGGQDEAPVATMSA